MTGYASCCVLSFNRAEFLKTAVQSLMENAGAPLELIIHDDGSSDPDVYRALRMMQSLHGATIITNAPGHNQGQGVALNRMFGMASGDPILKLDQDVVFAPGWLARVNHLLYMNRHASQLRYENRQKFEPQIGLLGLLHYHHDPVDSPKCKIAQHGGWQSHTHILGSAFAVTRECWRALGPFEEHDPAFGEDWTFQRKVTASEHFVCGLPDEDLVASDHMGIGPSTVVIAEGQVQPIHTGPAMAT